MLYKIHQCNNWWIFNLKRKKNMGYPTKYMKARYFLTALSMLEKQNKTLDEESTKIKNDILKKILPVPLKVIRMYYGFDGFKRKSFREIAENSMVLTPDNVKYQHTKALTQIDKCITKIDLFFDVAQDDLLEVVEIYLGAK
jgi:hypothetical protein